MTDITGLQVDNQNRQGEVKNSGYPNREQLQAEKKILILHRDFPLCYTNSIV